MINVRVYGDQCEGVISDPISRAFKRLGVCPTGTCGRGLTESSELLKLSCPVIVPRTLSLYHYQ